MYVYVHIYIRVCVLICTHTHIYSLPGVQVQEQTHCLVGWLSERPNGFTDLIGNPTGPGFAAVASDTPGSMDS